MMENLYYCDFPQLHAEDYNSTQITPTFQAGETEKTVVVPIMDEMIGLNSTSIVITDDDSKYCRLRMHVEASIYWPIPKLRWRRKGNESADTSSEVCAEHCSAVLEWKTEDQC